MTLELAMRCPALKEGAECGHFEGTGLSGSFKICLNRQDLVKIKLVSSHEKIKKGDIQKLHYF